MRLAVKRRCWQVRRSSLEIMSSKFSCEWRQAQAGDALKLPICKLEYRPMAIQRVL